MKLVPDWREAWRWFSVHVFLILAALPPVWATLPADVKAFLPIEWQPWVLCALALAGVLGRVKDQA